jgi:hypothetical protein
MLGLDCPSRFDMTLVAELRRPTTSEAIKQAIFPNSLGGGFETWAWDFGRAAEGGDAGYMCR